VPRSTLRQKDDGSLTLEATLVVPLVMAASFLTTIGVLLAIHEAMLLAEARISAERAADTWDESSKDVSTGAFVPYLKDSIYWKEFDDGFEIDIPFLVNKERKAEVQIDAVGAESAGGGLPVRKLLRLADRLPEQLGATLRFTRNGTDRTVTVSFNPEHAISTFLPALAVESSAPVLLPTELIRMIDFDRTYGSVVAEALDRRTIEALFLSLKNNDRPLSFATEAHARQALQRSVKGKEQWFFLDPSGRSRRLVDALDRYGVAHQAFLGYRALDASTRSQLKKDAELLKTGRVKGVIWHFYRKEKTGRIGPSASLAQELEKNGISIVLHG